MSGGRVPQLKLTLQRALLIVALPTACAVEVQPNMSDEGGDTGGVSGSAAGGAPLGGMAGSPAKAGTSSTSGGSVTNAFGGTASSGGKAGSGSGGSAGSSGGSGSGGSGKGGSGGSGGGTAGSGGGSAGGSGGSGGGAGGCGCKKTVPWVDNTNISWGPGDCLTLATKTYLYTGTKMQTYANIQCNPAKQETWCTDSGNDYKFMVCN
jgi:hypothetical protein